MEPAAAGSPLSLEQEALWWAEMARPGASTLHMLWAQQIRGPLNVTALRSAFGQVSQRHEILRTVFRQDAAGPVQIVMAHHPPQWIEVDLCGSPNLDAAVKERLAAASQRPFDLGKDALVRCVLLQVDRQDFVLLIVIHHLIFDGASWAILFGEVSSLYQGVSLEEVRFQYPPYAARQKVSEDKLKWWKDHLQRLPPPLELPRGQKRRVRSTLAGARESVKLSAALESELRSLGQRHGMTLFMVALAAFKAFLRILAEQDTIALCSSIDQRAQYSPEALGYFANNLILQTELDGAVTFDHVLYRVRKTCIDAFAHGDVPFKLVIEWLIAGRKLTDAAQLGITFAWMPLTVLQLPGLIVSPYEAVRPTADTDLAVLMSPHPAGGLRVTGEYATDVFTASQMWEMLQHFARFLARLARESDVSMAPLFEWAKAPAESQDLHCLGDILATAARLRPEATALVCLDHAPITYGALWELVGAVGRNLSEVGLGPSDRVGIVLPDHGLEMALIVLGVASHVAIAPINPLLRRAELEFCLRDFGIRAVIAGRGTAEVVEEVAASYGIRVLAADSLLKDHPPEGSSLMPLRPEDTALLLHTSGTTARPKIVPLSHRNICVAAQNISNTLGLGPDDRCLNVMPLFHIHGLSALLATLCGGGSFVCLPAYQAPDFFSWMDTFQPTWYTASPTIHRSILDRARQHQDVIRRGRLRFIRSASGPMPVSWLEEMEATFHIPFVEAYGMTETAPQMASNPLPPGSRKKGSVGPAAGVELAIMSADGPALLPSGSTGEVVVRGDNVFGGYEGNQLANEAAFIDGWFRTGDLGYLDEEGWLYITGRLKEVINRGGEKISPWEVDRVLSAHPAVAQAATFPLMDAVLGESVAAAIVLRAGASVTDRELQDHVAAHLADFKVPRFYVFAEQIPTTPTGKLPRLHLAHLLGVEAARPIPLPPLHSVAAPASPLQQWVADQWSRILGVSGIGPADNFFSLGGDSLLALRLLASVSEAAGVNLSMNDIFNEGATVAGFSQLLAQKGFPET